MAPLLNDDIKEQVSDMLSTMESEIAVYFFGTKEENCEYCNDAQQLIEEVSNLSDKIEFRTLDVGEDVDLAKEYHVEKTPMTVIARKDGDQVIDYGIRYAGIPAGHEFSSLIHTLILVASGESGLNDETKKELENLDKDIRLQVFVTPTCPYCPPAVILAHQMALQSPRITAEMVEATEFPALSMQYGVSGVPHTIINEGAGELVGAAPEGMLMEHIRKIK
ncbi:MAG: thioredoxin family protein [Anaerolineaceae bacterium]|nr:thioredoxin family protein [Anaerolineaceae bacterium]